MNKHPSRSIRGLLMLASLPLAGCAITPIDPWQRGELAQPEMRAEPDPLLSAYRRHMQTSKEAASGDAALPGGGCGCR